MAYDAAQLIAQLEPLAPTLCGDTVACSLVDGDTAVSVLQILRLNSERPYVTWFDQVRVEAHKRFNKLWQLLGRLVPQQQLLARPLILALDALDDDVPLVRMEASAWAITSLRQVHTHS